MRRSLFLSVLLIALALVGCQPKTPSVPPPPGITRPADPAPPGPAGAKVSRNTEPRSPGSFTEAPAAPTGPIQGVGSFNLKWLGLTGMHPRTDEHLEKIAGVILGTGMAMVGVQEVRDTDVLDRLVAFMPGWKYALGTSGRQQRCGILYDSRRAGIKRPVEWADINDGLEKAEGNLRAPLVTEAKVGDFLFTFIVLHNKAMFDAEALRTRREQMRRLRKRLDEYLAGRDNKNVIIVGDFNDFEDSAAMKELTGSRTGGVGFVVTGARLPRSAVTYMSRSGRIDHVVISSPFVSQKFWTGQAQTLPKPRGKDREYFEKYISDHLPTWATFNTAAK